MQALNLCSICVLFDHQRSYIDFQRASTNLNASQCKISISGQTRREYVEAGKVELRLKFALTCMGLHLHLTKALSQRQSIQISASPFKSAPVHSNQRQSIQINASHSNQRKSIQINASPFKSTQVHSNQHQSIQINASPFKSTPVHSNQRQSIQINASPFKSTPVHSSQRQSMKADVISSSSMQFKIIQRTSIQVNNRLLRFNTNPRIFYAGQRTARRTSQLKSKVSPCSQH